MVQKILDLHVHSKYSRACSKYLELPTIAKTCEIRGIDIVATGDFTHPAWFAHMKEWLVEDTAGIYKLKDNSSKTRFIIGTEIASIKKHAGQTRRVHHLIFAPNLKSAEEFNNKLDKRGINITADGRPIIGMTSKDILTLMLETNENMAMIPAHAWTPWFGIFGSKGGYNSLNECYEDLTPHIFAIETGLSSDPLMNWRWSHLDNISLISNSDAHSPQKLGREANVMRFSSDSEITYAEIMRVLRTGDKDKFLYTIEFYPEEGKYHMDGHRDCKFFCDPVETNKNQGICPKCKKPLVIGVLNRVEELSDRTVEEARVLKRVPYKSLVPLVEIISDTIKKGVASKSVVAVYAKLIETLGNEFSILLDASIENIEKAGEKSLAIAIDRVRRGEIYIVPGYDGEFGIVKVFPGGEGRNVPLQAGFGI